MAGDECWWADTIFDTNAPVPFCKEMQTSGMRQEMKGATEDKDSVSLCKPGAMLWIILTSVNQLVFFKLFFVNVFCK